MQDKGMLHDGEAAPDLRRLLRFLFMQNTTELAPEGWWKISALQKFSGVYPQARLR
jgi:hypothetical protein